MATNFNLKSTDAKGAVIRLLVDSYLIDCRWPVDMPENERMAWVKQTANEALVNRGYASQVDDNPDTMPDWDEPDPTFLEKVKGFFS